MNTITNNSGQSCTTATGEPGGTQALPEPSKPSSATCSRLAQGKRCPPETRRASSGEPAIDKRSKLVQDIAGNFPQELLDRDQWVCWKLEIRNDRPTKVPYSPRSARRASSTAASTWGSFAQASARLKACEELDGLGYVFSEDDPYCGVDFDHCIDPATGEIAPWALEWVEILQSYTELSPSATGLHVITRGQLSGSGRKRNGIEIYDRARFFTVTGHSSKLSHPEMSHQQDAIDWLYESLCAPKKPRHIPQEDRSLQGPELPDDIVIAHVLASPYKTTFCILFNGAWKNVYGSGSEADLAFTGILANFVGSNPTQIDRIYRSSGLFREKWDEQRGEFTYGERTINKALEK